MTIVDVVVVLIVVDVLRSMLMSDGGDAVDVCLTSGEVSAVESAAPFSDTRRQLFVVDCRCP